MKNFKTTLPSGLRVSRDIGKASTLDTMYANNELAFKDMVGTLQELAQQDWGDTLAVTVYIDTINKEETNE